MGAVTVRAATASLNLSYQLVTGEGSAVAVDEVVNLRSTKTSLAGIRAAPELPSITGRVVIRLKRSRHHSRQAWNGLFQQLDLEPRLLRIERRCAPVTFPSGLAKFPPSPLRPD